MLTVHNLVQLWRDGRRYLRTWPLAASLAQPLVDSRLVRIWRGCLWLAPGSALLSLWWLNMQAAPVAAGLPWLMPTLLASLPLQLQLVMGWRAAQPLPRAEARWLLQLRERLDGAGIELAPVGKPPTYQDLAVTLAVFDNQWPGAGV